VAHVGEAHEDRRGWQRERRDQYDRGYLDGLRAQPARLGIPPAIWKALATLVHPDRWQGTPALLASAHDAMVWLNQHRPPDER
jgi:hypothetical protein